MATLTVFTPLYNRINTLKRTYESLKRQTSKDFVWLIIDDGSTDNPYEIIKEWIKINNGFEIRYVYKKMAECIQRIIRLTKILIPNLMFV